jgi:uroporphyrinogen decarboxylase
MSNLVPLAKPQPDVKRFVDVVRGKVIPKRPPLAELFLDGEMVRAVAETCLGATWVPHQPANRPASEAFYRNWINVYYRMGYDFVRVGGGLAFTGKTRRTDDTAELSRGTRQWTEEGTGPIASWEDFEKYPWPKIESVDFSLVEFVAKNLPDGMGLFLCPSSGFLEIPLDTLLGYENLCYLLADDPSLVEAVVKRVGELIYAYNQNLLGLPKLCGFFQGDDMGFKTGTLVGPDTLRTYILPWHKKLAALAHDNGLIYMMHSCGKIDDIMDDLIDDVRIDARHSFEDEGNSVFDFKRKYGKRVTILGGVDVDKLCRLSEPELRKHVRKVLEVCMPGGRYCLGSGNSVTNYVPLQNYLAMVDEGFRFGG